MGMQFTLHRRRLIQDAVTFAMMAATRHSVMVDAEPRINVFPWVPFTRPTRVIVEWTSATGRGDIDCQHCRGDWILAGLLFFPKSPKESMLPPWIARPNTPRYSGFWRQGLGYSYYCDWRDRYEALSEPEKREYLARYPEPKPPEDDRFDVRSWRGICDDILEGRF